MFCRASPCSESKRAKDSSGKRRFKLRKHQKLHACRTMCIWALPLSRTCCHFEPKRHVTLWRTFGSATSCTNAICSNSRPGPRDKQQNAHAPRSKSACTSACKSWFRDIKATIVSARKSERALYWQPLRRPPYSKTSDVIAAKKLNRKPSQAAANSNSVVCYKCGRRGHVSSVCNLESKPRRCFACSGFGHISRNCPSRQLKQPQKFQLQSQKPNQK